MRHTLSLAIARDRNVKAIEFTPRALEPKLTRRLRSGDRIATDELYRSYRDRLYSFVSKRLGADKAAAEDIVQETFLAALDSLDGFRGDSQLYTWLCGIAYHKIVDFQRRQVREARLTQRRPGIEAVELKKGGEPEPTVPAIIESEETQHTVQQSLLGLPQDYREVLTLKYFEGLSVSEMSQVLHRSPKSVEGLLSRARKALRTNLVVAATSL